MNKIQGFVFKSGIAICSALFTLLPGGNVRAKDVDVGVSVSVGTPSFEIRAAADFYEPLTPYGRWEVVGTYGRCWVPSGVAVGWVPYSDGYWQLTDAGWFWVSDEPWAWATYHYGCWDFDAHIGWYWVPRTRWAPAWVSWRQGGGYVGWAPLGPSGAVASVNFVFVEERRFLEPVRPTTVIRKDTTIINKTTNINITKVVNNTVINEGPDRTVIERVSQKKLQPAAVTELRTKEEAKIASKQKNTPSGRDVKGSQSAEARPQPNERRQGTAQQTPNQGEKATPSPKEMRPRDTKKVPEKGPQVPAAKSAQPHREKTTPFPKAPQSDVKKAPEGGSQKPDAGPAQPENEKAAPAPRPQGKFDAANSPTKKPPKQNATSGGKQPQPSDDEKKRPKTE